MRAPLDPGSSDLNSSDPSVELRRAYLQGRGNSRECFGDAGSDLGIKEIDFDSAASSNFAENDPGSGSNSGSE